MRHRWTLDGVNLIAFSIGCGFPLSTEQFFLGSRSTLVCCIYCFLFSILRSKRASNHNQTRTHTHTHTDSIHPTNFIILIFDFHVRSFPFDHKLTDQLDLSLLHSSTRCQPDAHRVRAANESFAIITRFHLGGHCTFILRGYFSFVSRSPLFVSFYRRAVRAKDQNLRAQRGPNQRHSNSRSADDGQFAAAVFFFRCVLFVLLYFVYSYGFAIVSRLMFERSLETITARKYCILLNFALSKAN